MNISAERMYCLAYLRPLPPAICHFSHSVNAALAMPGRTSSPPSSPSSPPVPQKCHRLHQAPEPGTNGNEHALDGHPPRSVGSKPVKAVKAVAPRTLATMESVGPWFEPGSSSQDFRLSAKRFGRWPKRFFLGRTVGIDWYRAHLTERCMEMPGSVRPPLGKGATRMQAVFRAAAPHRTATSRRCRCPRRIGIHPSSTTGGL
jgi:hypothetical protein